MPKILLTPQIIKSSNCDETGRKVDLFDTHTVGLMVEIRKSSKSYYCRYQDTGGTVRQKRLAAIGEITLTQARELVTKYKGMLALGEDPFAKPEQEVKQKIMTFRQAVDELYLPHVKAYKRSWQTDECLLRVHVTPSLGDKRLNEITRLDIQQIVDKHRIDHKPGSTNRIVILMRYIFNCFLNWEVDGVVKNPTAKIPLLEENNKRERFISHEECRRLMSALSESQNPALPAIIAMLILTGARKNEVLSCTWDSFDLQRRIWEIRVNKSGKRRFVPLSDGVVTLLGSIERVEGNPYVFANPATGKPFVGIFCSWDAARKRAGLGDVRIHDLRHSFASFLINSGRSLYEVQKILGHTQVKTTQRYAHLSQDSLLAAVNEASKAVSLIDIMPKNLEQVALVQACSE